MSKAFSITQTVCLTIAASSGYGDQTHFNTAQLLSQEKVKRYWPLAKY